MALKTRLGLILLIVGIVNTALAIGVSVKQWKLSPEGLGPLKIGMSLKEAAQIKGISLSRHKPDVYENNECYTETIKGIKGLSLMISHGQIVRINVNTVAISTTAGAHIGDSETKLRSLYQGKLDIEPHRYEEKGHYFTYSADGKRQALRFETNGKRITRMYAGQEPQVYYVEDCL
ncbi:hypothetical protein [Legionella jordanis]|uniref:Uncharacterized protein n=1 Tax=Legionella jordanis TaxID=456 RepID=A0A0W0VEF5_9GAMM|nr:hypothetical protein [Legionella jordanis]KTD18472.1 hypothetical protein Ljor_2778 [Legionella jordanis]RMX05377.1 hypothetical protein EAW55_01575 [Legionella jordanis]RMX20775.1 hypothetical protein EAS68_05490 [Legionella jordanis]VEH13179.1 Uncharacterised protein [Legionella jordanis]HAT8715044.1 hypothetical protein [Legionella jordanis]